MSLEYSTILISILISFILAIIIFFLSFFLVTKVSDLEKISAYECGFDPFEDARNIFDVRFYLVAILFIIFDLEITFLFPWSTSINNISWFALNTMLIFLILLTIGFVYEWKKGAISWE